MIAGTRFRFRTAKWRRSHVRAYPGASTVLAAVLLMAALPGHAETGRTLDDAVYSKAQARSGRELYDRHCIACHDRNYFRQVLGVRRGETLEPLFEAMVTLMPQNAPGSLTDGEYVDVIAYILERARYPDGKKRLKSSELGAIVIPPAAP